VPQHGGVAGWRAGGELIGIIKEGQRNIMRFTNRFLAVTLLLVHATLIMAAANPITLDVSITDVSCVEGTGECYGIDEVTNLSGADVDYVIIVGTELDLTKVHTATPGTIAPTSWFRIKDGQDESLIDLSDTAQITGGSPTTSVGRLKALHAGEIVIEAVVSYSGVYAYDEISIAIIELETLQVTANDGEGPMQYVIIGQENKDTITITATCSVSIWPPDLRWEYRHRPVGGQEGEWTDFEPVSTTFDSEEAIATWKPTICGEYQFRALLCDYDTVGAQSENWILALPKIKDIIVTEIAAPNNTISWPSGDCNLYLFNRQNDKTVKIELTTDPVDRNGTGKYLAFRNENCAPNPVGNTFEEPSRTSSYGPTENEFESHVYYGYDTDQDGTLSGALEDIDYIYLWFIKVKSMTVVDHNNAGASKTNPPDTKMTIVIGNAVAKVDIGADIIGGAGDENKKVLHRLLSKNDASLTSGTMDPNPTAIITSHKGNGPFKAQVAEDYNHDGIVQDNEVVFEIKLMMTSAIEVYDQDSGTRGKAHNSDILKVVPRNDLGGGEIITLTFEDPDLVSNNVQWSVNGPGGGVDVPMGHTVTFEVDDEGPFPTQSFMGEEWLWAEEANRGNYTVSVDTGDGVLQQATIIAHPTDVWRLSFDLVEKLGAWPDKLPTIDKVFQCYNKMKDAEKTF